MKTKEVAVRQRELKEIYRTLYKSLSNILFLCDPVGINFGENEDEYELEVGTILPRLRGVSAADAVRHIVHEEFVHWFGANAAGPESRYDQVAAEIWQLIAPQQPSTNKPAMETMGRGDHLHEPAQDHRQLERQ